MSKEQPTPLDTAAISGLYFLDGDMLARVLRVDWTVGQKAPMLDVPSGLSLEVWESRNPHNPIIHLFGEMDLPYQDTRDTAYEKAQHIVEQVGYVVSKVGDTQLDLWSDEGRFLVTYDNLAGHMVNVESVRPKVGESARPPRPPLLDEASWKQLPPLYSQEALGLNAIAYVKFFTPDANWTWYVSEASAYLDDGTYKTLQEIAPDDPHIAAIIFFGLVDGYELEFGNFTLEELEEITGAFSLPVERDKFFTPTIFKELQALHKRRRGE